MRQDRLVQMIAGGVLVVSLALSTALSASMAAEAGRAQLTYTDQATEGAPREVAVGIALGAFRGLFVNYLWLRATELKEAGKFHEAIELSSAITKLQPRFPRVWAFHAWNMAYNISVATPSASERWTWINAGIELLRDEAIPRNPRSTLLYKELAWIFFHKIQGYSDDANRSYKREFAREWTYVLGIPPAMPDTHDEATKAMIDWFKPVADAPQSIAKLIDLERDLASADPDWREGEPFDPTVDDLLADIRDKVGLDPSSPELLRFIVMRQVYHEQWEDVYGEDEARQIPFNLAVNGLLDDPKYARAWSIVLPYLRARVLRDHYKMLPERMLRLTELLGPLDWRHPASHAIYWSASGVAAGFGDDNWDQFHSLNTDRVTIHSIQELYRTGTILYDLFRHEYMTFTDNAWIEPYGQMMEEAVSRGGRAAQHQGYTTFREGYENFLKDVIRNYWMAGEPQLAMTYKDKLCNDTQLNENDPWHDDMCKLQLVDFVKSQKRDRLSIPQVAASEFYGSIFDGFYRGLIRGDTARFSRSVDYARYVHEQYFILQPTRTTADEAANRMDEIDPNFQIAFIDGIINVMLTMPATDAMKAWPRLSIELQRLLYDPLFSSYRQRGYSETLLAQRLPEPPGMKEFREVFNTDNRDTILKRDIEWVKQ